MTEPALPPFPAPASPPPPSAPPRWRRVALAVAGAVVALGAAVSWLVGTETGLEATLALIRGASGGRVQAEGVQGRLWDSLSIARLSIDAEPTGPRVVIDDTGLDWHPAALFRGHLDIARLAASRVEVASPTNDAPLTPPADLSLPLAVHIAAVHLDQLVLRRLDSPAQEPPAPAEPAPATPPGQAANPASPRDNAPTAAPVSATAAPTAGTEILRLSALTAQLASDGRRHRLTGLAATWEQVRLSGDATLDGGALASPEAVAIQARARGSADGREFQVNAQARGPLATLKIAAQASAAPGASSAPLSHAAPTASAGLSPRHALPAPSPKPAAGKPNATPLRGSLTATLAPFAPWPLTEARGQVRGLNPAAWAADAPQAALDLDLQVGQDKTGAHPTPVGRLTAVNAHPGPLDQGRLPVAGLTLVVRPAPQDAPAEGRDTHTGRPSTPPGNPQKPPAGPSSPTAGSALPPLALALEAFLPGAPPGHLTGQGTLRDGRLAATLTVAGVDAHTLHGAAQATRIDGTLTLSADPARQRLQAVLENRNAPPMRLTADLTRVGPRLTLHQARLSEAGPDSATPPQSAALEASGSLTLGAVTAFAFDGTARNLDLARFIKAPPTRLSATLKASGQVGEGPGLPRLELAYRLTDSRINGQPTAGDGRLAIVGRRLADADLRLAVGDNKLEAAGRFGAPADRLRFTLSAPRLDPVAGAFGLTGSLEVRGELHGTWADPGGRITVVTPRLGLPGGLTMSGLDARLALDSGPDGEANGRLLLKRLGQGSGRSQDPAAADSLVRDTDLQVAGTKRRQDWTFHGTLLENQGLARTLTLSASGGLAHPEKEKAAAPRWLGRLTALDLGGDLPLRLQQPASLDLAAQRIAIADARFQGGGSAAPWSLVLQRLEWQAGQTEQNSSARSRATTAPHLSSSGELHGLPARLLLPTAARASTLTLGGSWSLALNSSANGQFAFSREQGDLLLGDGGDAPLSLGLNALSLGGRLDRGRVKLALDGRGARLGTLTGQLGAQLLRAPEGAGLLGWTLAQHSPLGGEARLQMPDLAWIAPLAYPGLTTGGTVAARVQLAGSPAAPQLTGEIHGSKLALRQADLGLNLGNGILEARLTGGHLQLGRLHFDSLPGETPREVRLKDLLERVAGRPGTVDVSGDLDLRAGASSLAWSLERLVPLQRRSRWLMASGQGQVRIAANKLEVAGELKADGAFLGLPDLGAPSLPDDVVVKGRKPPAEARLRLTRLDLGLNLGSRFFFKGAGLDSRLDGDLRLTTRDDGTLRANGAIRAVDGIFDAYGTRLAIDRGIVSFQGPPDRPSLNIRALRRGLAVEAGVDVTGTVDRPLIKLVSVPEVPEAEKLSWMVLGKGPGEAGSADPALLLSAASALFGSEGGTTRRLQDAFGIDEISFRSGNLDGSGGPTATSRVASSQGFSGTNTSTSNNQVLTVGKRIAANATLAYEQSIATVAAQAGSAIRLTVDLTRRLSVVARAGTDNALDLLYTFSFGGSDKAQPRRDSSEAHGDQAREPRPNATPRPAPPRPITP